MIMPEPATLDAVRRDILVQVPPERAFAVFTQGFDRWWPRSHHIGAAEMGEAVIEPRADGRWYERGVDGSECTWGEVLAYDAPRRLVLSWHLNGEWAYDPDPAHASEIEVTFTPDGDGTRVELVHRGFERHGATAEALRDGVSREGGWGGLLELYAEASKSSEQELMQ
jgi:uncharacterized protein YndB with AHSA1/START domain